MLYLKCEGQVVKIVEDERLADKYINANTVHFDFCERWADMVITAQFTQKRTVLNPETQKQEEETYTFNVLVDEVTSTVTMPNEIEAGKVDISAFGVHPETGVRITTIPVTKTVDKSGFVGDGETLIPPTPDLYTQLIAQIEDAEEIQAEKIQTAVDNYLDENPVSGGATAEQAAQIEANRQAIENYVPPVTSVNGMTGDVTIAGGGGVAESVAWENVTGKPDAYPPEEHTHSYTDLADKPTIPVVPNFLPNPYPLMINGESYDGSEAVSMELLTQDSIASDSAKLNGKSADQYALQTDLPTKASDVGALAENAQAADSAKLGGKAPEYYIQPRNLLDNSDFTNPVNQRGISTLTASAHEYTIDRWRLDSKKTITVNNGSITLDGGWLTQYIGETIDPEKTYTAAALLDDGTLIVETGVPANKTRKTYFGFDVTAAGVVYIGIRVAGSYKWAALYEGTYTADTLPPYVPKEPVTELMTAYQYALNIGGVIRYRATQITSSIIDFIIPIPVKMRTTPSFDASALTVHGTSGNMTSATAQTGFTFSILQVDDNAICIRATKSKHGLVDAFLSVAEATVFSADL